MTQKGDSELQVRSLEFSPFLGVSQPFSSVTCTSYLREPESAAAPATKTALTDRNTQVHILTLKCFTALPGVNRLQLRQPFNIKYQVVSIFFSTVQSKNNSTFHFRTHLIISLALASSKGVKPKNMHFLLILSQNTNFSLTQPLFSYQSLEMQLGALQGAFQLQHSGGSSK